jgi:organic radical activating enzyme
MPGALPPAINLHFWKPCNYRCKFCFAIFDDDDALRSVRGGLCRDDAVRLIEMLGDAGADKVNFVGGEPTLAPHIGDLLVATRRAGLVTSIVTNGERLAPWSPRTVNSWTGSDSPSILRQKMSSDSWAEGEAGMSLDPWSCFDSFDQGESARS